MPDPLLDVLLRDIIAHPAEDGYRLVYADRCEENGGHDRADFIRLQIRLAPVRLRPHTPPALLAREMKHLREHGRAWTPPEVLEAVTFGTLSTVDAAVALSRLHFRRGFVAEVTLGRGDWVRHGPALVRAAPLESVHLADWRPALWPDGTWVLHDSGAGNDVPPAIFDHLRPVMESVHGPDGPEPRFRAFPSERAAREALSAALLAWAVDNPGPRHA